MKKYLSNCLPFTLLLILLQPTSLHPQYHNADSLRQVIRAALNDMEGYNATALLAQELMPQQLDSARILLERAHPLENSPVLYHRAQYHNVWGLYYWFKMDRQASIRHFKKTLALPGEPDILPLQAAAANNIGSHFFRLGEPDSSRVYLLKALYIDTERGHLAGAAKNYYDLSRLHRSLDQYELALRYIKKGIRILEDDGDKVLLKHSYNVLGNIYNSINEPEKAVNAYERYQVMAKEMNKTTDVIKAYNNLSALWCSRSDGLEQTIHYFESGIDEARALGQPDMIAALLANMGTAWVTAGDPARAIGFLEEAIAIVREEDIISKMEVYFMLGRAHRKLDRLPQARQYFENSYDIATRVGSANKQSRALLHLASLDSLQGDLKGFIDKYARGIKLRDSIWNNENRSRIAELQIIHDIEQKDMAIAQLEQRNRMIRFRQRTIIGVSLLMISLLVIALLYIQKRRIESHQQFIIKKQEKEMVDAQLETNRRELTGKALSLARSDQLIKQLKQDIQAVLARSDNKSCNELRSALRILKTTENSQVLWKEFETRFNDLNEGFISRLTGRYPSLSPAEIRLCAMLRLQMSTKDIADMIRRSTRTVEYTRNNVRKKMGLSLSDNLVQHLLNI